MFNIDSFSVLRPLRASCGCVLLAWMASCDNGTEVRIRPLPGPQPMQVNIDVLAGPSISYTHTVGDEENWQISVGVKTQDSTLHTLWRPTAVHVDVRGKGTFEDLLVPIYCVESQAAPYPDNFAYFICNEVFLRHSRSLSSREIRDLEEQLGGSEMIRAGSSTDPDGVLYVFEVPVNREAVEEAIRRLLRYPGAVAAGKWPVEVTCNSSTEPPCIPWSAWKAYYGHDFGGVVLEFGDTLDITYHDAAGHSITAVRVITPPFQI